jgi:death-on-curing protein
MNIRWISRATALAVHDEQLAEHGGEGGLRDAGLLDSALARAANRAEYATPDLFELAAAYGFGLVADHPFVDGNKRTGTVLMELFLELNGQQLTAGDGALVGTILSVAEGSMAEDALADWLRRNCRDKK